jgi:hypothetical protein
MPDPHRQSHSDGHCPTNRTVSCLLIRIIRKEAGICRNSRAAPCLRAPPWSEPAPWSPWWAWPLAACPGDAVGNTARIWVSRSGSPTGAPRGRSEPLGWTPIAEVGTALALALICFLAVRLQRWLFERSRLARWHRAWRAQGPRWTGQRLLPPSLRSSPRTGDAGHVMSGQSDLHDGSADRGVPREAAMSLPAGERGRLRVMGRLPSSSDSRLVPLFSMRHH